MTLAIIAAHAPGFTVPLHLRFYKTASQAAYISSRIHIMLEDMTERHEKLHKVLESVQALSSTISSSQPDFSCQHALSTMAEAQSIIDSVSSAQDSVELQLYIAIRHASGFIIDLCSHLRRVQGYSPRQQDVKMARTSNATLVLKLWYTKHLAYPYPTELEKSELSEKCGLTNRQVSMWFINARRRSHKGQKFVAEQVSEEVKAVVT